jgi:predicted peptidase
MKNFLILTVALWFCSVATDTAYCEEQPGKQVPAELNVQVPVQLNYLLYLPKDYEKQDNWPLVLFLHGAGERGTDLEAVKKHGPPKLIAAGKEFPFIVVSPQCAKDKWWDPFALLVLMNEISRKYKVDADRVYVTGISMGGFGTWMLAAYAPEKIAAIVPICGGGDTAWTRRYARMPVWAFHGAKDTSVALERSQAMIDALKKHGGEPRLTIYPDAGHDAWTETYDNPELYEWLLAQKRPK